MALGLQNSLAVSGQDREDPLDRIGRQCMCWSHYLSAEGYQIQLQHGLEQRFLTIEKMIKAAAIDVGPRQQVRHTGAREASFPEKIERRIEQALASFGLLCHLKKACMFILAMIYLNDQPTI